MSNASRASPDRDPAIPESPASDSTRLQRRAAQAVAQAPVSAAPSTRHLADTGDAAANLVIDAYLANATKPVDASDTASAAERAPTPAFGAAGSPFVQLGVSLPAEAVGGAAPSGQQRRENRVGRYTYVHHRMYSALMGAYEGLMNAGLIAYFVIREMPGGDSELIATLMHWLPGLAAICSPLFFMTDPDIGPRKERAGGGYWLFVGLFGRVLPGVICALAGLPWHFIAIFTGAAFICSGVSAAQNTLLARNYTRQDRERYFGMAKMYQIPACVAANLLLGTLLDANPESYRIVLPIAGLVGLAAALTMRRVKLRRPADLRRYGAGAMRGAAAMPVAPRGGVQGDTAIRRQSLVPLRLVKERIVAPFRASFRLMLDHKEFGIYEIGFFTYGAAFMMLLPVVPVYFKHVFDIDLKGFSTHTVLAFQGTMFLCHLLLRGRHSSWSAPRTAATAFGTLIGYPALLLVAALTHQIAFALAGFIVFGVGMTLVDYAWNLGPIRFARGGDALPYSSTHVMMAGLRALIAYPISYGIMKLSGANHIFSLAIPMTLFVIAATIMVMLDRRIARTATSVSARM